jgi:hypothetical protein
MPLHRPKVRASRASISLAVVLGLSACGGNSGEPKFTNFQPASVAIGQPDLVSGQANRGGAPSASGLDQPYAVALTPAGGLLVSELNNHRVLFYPSVPSTSGAAAAAVLGQPDFGSSAPGFNKPLSVAVGAGKMAVVDSESNRVLIYDRIPAPGEPLPEPVAVIGQPNFQSTAASCGAGGLSRPFGVFISPEGKLIVADTQNSRLLVWNTVPAAGTFAPVPDLVLGQSDLDHCAFRDHDQDGDSDRVPGSTRVVQHATARSMQPFASWTDGKRLAVLDTSSSRVLIWNTFPTVNFQPADVVLGHPDFSNTEPNDVPPGTAFRDQDRPSARTFREPRGLHSDGVGLAVADSFNHRVLIWNSFPTANFQPADVVLGQPGFDRYATEDGDNNGLPDAPAVPNPQILNVPMNVVLTSDSLITTDLGQNRVLVFRKQ